MFVDLDPTEGTSFARVMQAAKAIGEVLEQAKLKVFLKTSGATGLHIFIPMREIWIDQCAHCWKSSRKWRSSSSRDC